MTAEPTRDEFTLDSTGKTYNCARVVTGEHTLTQVVEVAGCGSKEDAAVYGLGHRPIESMKTNARLIAREVINESFRKK